jgi:hypothetical protein
MHGFALVFAERGLASERHDARPNMTLWQTIDSLARQIPFKKASIEHVLATRLAVKDISRDLLPNTASQFYIGGPVELSDGVVIDKVDLRIRHKTGHPGFLVLDKFGGTCISLSAVRSHYHNLTVTEYPKGQSLDESTSFSAFLEWGKLSFGFAERNRKCLAYVVLKPTFDEDDAPYQ